LSSPLADPLPIIPFDGPVDAVVQPPGSKSLTNRALLAAALASGRSVLTGALFADDTEAMLECVQSLGAIVSVDRGAHIVTVDGVGGSLARATGPFRARQSGTTARFIAATLALGSEPFVLDADDAMRRRPMRPVLNALASLGAMVESLGESDRLPVSIAGRRDVPAAMPTVVMAGNVSSQFTSGLLLAAACMPAGLRVELTGEVVSRPYLDMTVAIMRSFGGTVMLPDDRTFVVEPTGYRGADLVIEPDASAASYFFAVAALCGGTIRIDGLGTDSMQGDLAFVDELERMGAFVERAPRSTTVTGGVLRGITADFSQISDTAQTIAAVAVFADDPTVISGIGFIRGKETDRIAAVVGELHRLGIDASEDVDGFTIMPGPITPTTVETHDDHRMAMSFALVGLRVPGVSIADPGCVAKTYPTYFEEIERIRPGGVQ
jgi:3-phosphoshikimate 1-carboxyvinyltransferase